MPGHEEVIRHLMEPTPEIPSAEQLIGPEEQEAIKYYLEQLYLTLLRPEEITRIVQNLTKPEAVDLLKTLNIGSTDVILLLQEGATNPDGSKTAVWRRAPGQSRALYLVNQSSGRTQKGGMGEVWTAFELKVHRRVGIKVVDNKQRSPDFDEWLEREAVAQARGTNPNLLPIYTILETQDGPALVMKYMDPATHPTLRRVLRGDRIGQGAINYDNPITTDRINDVPVINPERLRMFVRSMATGLGALHKQGVYHLDLKPGNIFMAPEDDHIGDIVGDFGLTNISRDMNESMGTPQYMAPESVLGDEVDGRTDMFALSLIIYEMMTGKTLVSGDNVMVVQMKIVNLHGSLGDLNTNQGLLLYCQQYGLNSDLVANFLQITLGPKEKRPLDMEEYADLFEFSFRPETTP